MYWFVRKGGEAWQQLELETGFCNLASGYSAEMVRNRVLKGPEDVFGVVVRAWELLRYLCIIVLFNCGLRLMTRVQMILQCRAVTMVVTLGTYYVALESDKLSGQSESPERTRLRAAQLRLIIVMKHINLYVYGIMLHCEWVIA